jgi:hypothetical protein
VAKWYDSTAEENKRLVTRAARTVAVGKDAASAASDISEAAKERAARIERGDDVGGALGKPKDLEGVLTRIIRPQLTDVA